MEKKINILVAPTDFSAVSNFRLVAPYIELQKNFPNEFNIDIINNNQISYNDRDFLGKYDIIHGHKTFVEHEQSEKFALYLKELNIISILDIDDYWSFSKDHPLEAYINHFRLDIKIPKTLSYADYVTTTNDFFANRIKHYNKNVFVFPNALDETKINKYINDKESSDRLRFGYLGGSSHEKDLLVMQKAIFKINKKFLNKIQWVFAGFNSIVEMSEITENGEINSTSKNSVNESTSKKYEDIFTENLNIIKDKNYYDFLTQYNEIDKIVKDQPYVRLWHKGLTKYSEMYNYMDVSLAPLNSNEFNRMKSNLKLIEAGFHKIPIIASDIEPYKQDIIHGYNGFLVKNNSGIKNWDYYIEYFIKHPEKVKEMGENLYNTVKDKYSISTVTEQRAIWLKSLLKTN